MPSRAARRARASAAGDDALLRQHDQMGVVNGHQRRQQQLLGIFEVVVEDAADVFRRKSHQDQYIPREERRVPDLPSHNHEARCRYAARHAHGGRRLPRVGAGRRPPRPCRLPGVSQPVEIIRDRWGVNHIYAQNEVGPVLRAGLCGRQRSLVPVRALATASDRNSRRDSGTARSSSEISVRGCTCSAAIWMPNSITTIPAARRSSKRTCGASTPTSRRPSARRACCRSSSRCWESRPADGRRRSSSRRHQALTSNLTDEVRAIRAMKAVGPSRGARVDVLPGRRADLHA